LIFQIDDQVKSFYKRIIWNFYKKEIQILHLQKKIILYNKKMTLSNIVITDNSNVISFYSSIQGSSDSTPQPIEVQDQFSSIQYSVNQDGQQTSTPQMIYAFTTFYLTKSLITSGTSNIRILINISCPAIIKDTTYRVNVEQNNSMRKSSTNGLVIVKATKAHELQVDVTGKVMTRWIDRILHRISVWLHPESS
jgi:hypothetical protein